MKRPQKFTIEIRADEKELTVKIDNSIEAEEQPAAAPSRPRRRPAAKKKRSR